MKKKPDYTYKHWILIVDILNDLYSLAIYTTVIAIDLTQYTKNNGLLK